MQYIYNEGWQDGKECNEDWANDGNMSTFSKSLESQVTQQNSENVQAVRTIGIETQYAAGFEVGMQTVMEYEYHAKLAANNNT